nr:ATP-binding protein [Streptomyces tirandamycinicus]
MDESTESTWSDLPFVYELVPEVEDRFQSLGYSVDQCRDPDAAALASAVDAALAGEYRVVHVISHGEIDPANEDRLDVVPSCSTTGGRTDVGAWLSDAQRRRRHMLFLVDACRSGRAARQPFLTKQAGRETYAWVIAAAASDQDAYNGKFTRALIDVLGELRRDGLGTHPMCRYVTFSNFAKRISRQVNALGGIPQDVYANPVDPSMEEPELPFFPNPRYVDHGDYRALQKVDAPIRSFLYDLEGMDPADVHHFLDKVGTHFVGRRSALERLAPWLDDTAAGGLCVVTGSPGVGKSALLGALVCSAHPDLVDAVPGVRDRLLAQDAAGCPSVNHLLAAVHARQRTIQDIVVSIASQLRLTAPAETWDVESLIAAVRVGDGRGEVPPAIIIDALDEAVDPQGTAQSLLMPLALARTQSEAPACRLLVGMRPWEQFASLRDLAESDHRLIDLDKVTAAEQRSDLRAYLLRRLASTHGYDTAQQRKVREALADRAADRLTETGHSEWGAFLVAGLFCRYLSTLTAPADVDNATHLGASIPRTLPEVLELDLEAQPSGQTAVRALLSALAHAKGDGMPWGLAFRLAAALSPAFHEAAQDHVLEQARFYLRSSVDRDGTGLYRLFHQGLADYLRQVPDGPSSLQPEEGDLA